MTRQEIPEQPQESKFWKPEIGSQIEGELLGIATHEYEGKQKSNYVLKTKEGKEIELPSHVHLEAKMSKTKPGNYIWISCIGEKTVKTGSNPMKVYKVEYDPDHIPTPSLNTTEPSKNPVNAPGSTINQVDGLYCQLAQAITLSSKLGQRMDYQAVEKITHAILPSGQDTSSFIHGAKMAGWIVERDGIFSGTE